MHDTEASLEGFSPFENAPAPASSSSRKSEAPGAPSWTAGLLAPSDGWRGDARRFGIGVALATTYGLALGAREGGSALLSHAAGVAAAIVAVGGLGVPALAIVLALFDAPITPARIGASASRAAAAMGLVLAGLAPAVALLVVSCEGRFGAAAGAALGLIFAAGGARGQRRPAGVRARRPP